jgi:hypothetical protein
VVDYSIIAFDFLLIHKRRLNVITSLVLKEDFQNPGRLNCVRGLGSTFDFLFRIASLRESKGKRLRERDLGSTFDFLFRIASLRESKSKRLRERERFRCKRWGSFRR